MENEYKPQAPDWWRDEQKREEEARRIESAERAKVESEQAEAKRERNARTWAVMKQIGKAVAVVVGFIVIIFAALASALGSSSSAPRRRRRR